MTRIALVLPAGPSEPLVAALAEAGADVTVCAERELVATVLARGSVCGALAGTSEGVAALRALEAKGKLQVPCIDTRYGAGSGQSAVLAVLDATNLLLAGKRFVCVGYGSAGKGIAKRARGLAADVTVCEVDPVAAVEAHDDGFAVAPLVEACACAEILITAAGAHDVLRAEAIDALPDGAIVATDERGRAALAAHASEVRRARERVAEYVVGGRSLFVVDPPEGDPPELVDLRLSVQALAARYLLRNGASLEPRVYTLPGEIDEELARLRLEGLGLRIDSVDTQT